MKYLNQIKFYKKDQSSFLVPKLEKQIRQKEYEIKKIGCYISFFSVEFIECLQYSYQNSTYSQNYSQTLFLTAQYLLQILSCLLCAYFIDIMSIKSSWIFIIVNNILFQMIHLSSVLFNNFQMSQLAIIASQILHFMSVINFSCVLYESATSFKDRFNNVVKLQAYGVYFPYIITLCLDYLITEYFKMNEEQSIIVKKYILICSIMFCQLINTSSLIILNKTYQQIEKIKIFSDQYKRFLIYQGVGLSLSKIFKYFKNKDIYYVLVLSALLGCQYDSQFYLTGDIFSSSLQSLIVNVFGMFFCYIMMKIINNQKILVQTNYKAISCCLYLFIITTVFLTINEIISYETNLFSQKTVQFINTFLLTIKESLDFILYCLLHQILIILLPKRSAIRAISLSITYIVYIIFNMLIMMAKNIIQLRIAQIILTLITIIIDYMYQKNIYFNKIEQQIIKQYNINQS